VSDSKTTKEQLTVYLSPENVTQLRRDRADSRRSVSEILDDITREHYTRQNNQDYQAATA
jgi:hypothetical protein